jgi:high-affinity Fe2+/Pb2+ permease
MLLVNGSLSVIDAVANEILLPEAVAVENPYCTGWVLYDSLRFVAIVLLFTIPALVFKWCAYGRSAAPAVPEPVWRALGRLYAASLPLAALYLALQRLGIVPDTSNLWC